MKHKLFIVSLSLAILLGSCATVLPRRVENFNGDWTFHLGEVVEASLPEFDDTGWRPAERLPVARELGETSLMFLVHPGLTATEIDRTVEVVAEVMGEAVR